MEIEKFDFSSIPFKLSGKVVNYICPKCKHKYKAPIEMVLEFEQEDEWNGLPISTPPYTICSKCQYDKCVPIDYKSKKKDIITFIKEKNDFNYKLIKTRFVSHVFSVSYMLTLTIY